MTLSNVFMGKKVVQQIYFNNALIYQAKGWETLPCAPTEVWTKSYDSINLIKNCAVDQDNNIYIVIESGYVFKISPEGIVLWSKSFGIPIKICIDQKNNVYLVQLTYYKTNNFRSAVVSQLDSEGNIINSINASNNVTIDQVTDFVVDNNYLYVSVGYYAYGTNYLLFRIDKNFKNSCNISMSSGLDYLTTNNTCPYIYWASGVTLYQIAKDTIGNSNAKGISINDGFSPSTITNIVMDDIGNLIYSTNKEGTYRYNIDTKKFIKIPYLYSSTNSTMCIDYQQNFYGINADNTNLVAKLFKVSSDNTIIYNTQILKGDSNFTDGRLIADNNGNIYYIYKKAAGQLMVTKLINVIKKG